MKNGENQNVWLTAREVSERTGIGCQTLANLRYLGRGFAYCKVGRSVRYFWPDVLQYLESRKIYPEGN